MAGAVKGTITLRIARHGLGPEVPRGRLQLGSICASRRRMMAMANGEHSTTCATITECSLTRHADPREQREHRQPHDDQGDGGRQQCKGRGRRSCRESVKRKSVYAVQKPIKVETTDTVSATTTLLANASHTSGSLKMVWYHLKVKWPSGMVGKRSELKENTKLARSARRQKANTTPM